MPEIVMVDSDILSEVLRGRNSNVIEAVSQYLDHHDRLTISAITVAEIVKGLIKQGNILRSEIFLASRDQTYRVLPITSESGRIAGKIIAELEMSGRVIGAFDSLIAATAIEHKLPLITGNERHFKRVQDAGFPLRIGNWRNSPNVQ